VTTARRWRILATALLGAGSAAQQVPVPQMPPPGLRSPWDQGVTADRRLGSPTGDPDVDAVTPVWTDTPRAAPFLGFPTFPQLGGVGQRPMSLADLFANTQVGTARVELPSVPPSAADTGWPSWLRLEGRQPLPYEPAIGLLVQRVERVWWQDAGDDVFVPLYPYDKLRPFRAGVAIEVRQSGACELLFHGGGYLAAQGRAALRVDRLDDEVVAVTVRDLTHLRLVATGREHRLTLPDGSTLVVAASPPGAPSLPANLLPGLEAPTPDAVSHVQLVIERRDEPGWRCGRATIWNGGAGTVEWQHAFGVQQIAPRERVTILLTPLSAPIAAGLVAGEVRPDGDAVVCRAAAAGTVSWCGARFTIGAAGRVRFEPGIGSPFAAPASK
jgi:hypothetical protein